MCCIGCVCMCTEDMIQCAYRRVGNRMTQSRLGHALCMEHRVLAIPTGGVYVVCHEALILECRVC
jgi:hypothetical protein